MENSCHNAFKRKKTSTLYVQEKLEFVLNLTFCILETPGDTVIFNFLISILVLKDIVKIE